MKLEMDLTEGYCTLKGTGMCTDRVCDDPFSDLPGN